MAAQRQRLSFKGIERAYIRRLGFLLESIFQRDLLKTPGNQFFFSPELLAARTLIKLRVPSALNQKTP